MSERRRLKIFEKMTEEPEEAEESSESSTEISEGTVEEMTELLKDYNEKVDEGDITMDDVINDILETPLESKDESKEAEDEAEESKDEDIEYSSLVSPERFMKKFNVFLDLDETIISSIPSEEFPFDKTGIKKKALEFAVHNMLDYYITFERPYLQEFLDYLFKNYHVNVWTAASKDYALFVVNDIIIGKHTDRKVDYIFYDYHCKISSKFYNKNPKNLKLLWEKFGLSIFNDENTLLIDDNPKVYKDQDSRVLKAKPFNFLDKDSTEDDFLLKLLTGDLRGFINKNFNLY